MLEVITEAYLRAKGSKYISGNEVCLPEKYFLTPSAKDYIKEKGLTVVTEKKAHKEMKYEPIRNIGKYKFTDLEGNMYEKKPEHMTHLRSNILVLKNNSRIALRGKIDSLEAKILEVQVVANNEGNQGAVDDLQEILDFAREVLACEVKESPFPPLKIFGFEDDEIRDVSHNVFKYFGINHLLPDYKMGRVAIAINSIRTSVREAEIAAACAFMDSDDAVQREDIIKALNRLSSAVYIAFCREVSGYYKNGSGK